METPYVRALIANDRIDKAIQLIILATQGTSLADEATSISASYRRYSNELMKDLLSAEDGKKAFASVTNRLLNLLRAYDLQPLPVPDANKSVFISYAWGGDSEIITDQIDKTLQSNKILIIRDKRDVNFRSSIKDFMETLGKGKCIIVIISDRYLKSKNCLYELLQISSHGSFVDRIFPVVLKDANIFDAKDLIGYVEYWELQIKELKKAIKKISPENLHGIREDLDLYSNIRAFLPRLVDKIRDMNTLTPEAHRDTNFEELYNQIIHNL